MKRLLILILTLAPWIAVHAQNKAALEFQDSTNGTQVGVGFVTGYQFTLKTPVQLTQLGAVLTGSSSSPIFGALPASMPVGLWDSSRNLVASAVVSSANPRTGHFNFAAVTPALLKAGEVYTVGGLVPAGQSVLSQVLGITTAAEVNYVAPVSMISSSLAFPTGDVIKAPNGYLGPGFAFTTTSGTGAGGSVLPYGVSVTPPAGSGAFGVAQNLTAVWASPAGQPALTLGSLLIQDSAVATPTPSNACLLRVVTTGGVQLGDDTGALSGGYSWVGNSWTISPSNTHCQLNGPQSSQVTLNGVNEQVTLNLQFSQAWAGKTLSIWMQGTNTNYVSGTWQNMGTFTVTGPVVTPPSFTLSATAASAAAGASGSSTVTVNPANGFNSAVTLAASGWPAGITGVFGTNPTTGTSSVTINVGSGVPVGPYTLTVSGSGGGLSASTTIGLNVTQGAGSGGTLLPYGVSVTPSAGTGAAVVAQNLTAVWASPAGQPALSWGSLLIQDSAVAAPAPANACLLRVVTTGGAQLGDDTGALNGGYAWVGNSWTISPSNAHCQLNGPQSSVVTLNGANEQVTLNLQFNPAWVGKTLAIWMQGTNTSYQSGTWQKMGTFTVTGSALPPSYTLGATAASAVAGASGSSTVTVNPANGFNSAVTLAASGWPAGVTGVFGTNPTTSASSVTINVGSGVAAGPYALTVNGSGGGVSASTTIALNVTPAAGGGGTLLPYGVSVTPSSGSGAAGAAQNLTFIWASPAGQPGLTLGSLLIQDSAVATPSPANACLVRVVTTGGVQLGDDTGALGGDYAWVGNSWTISPSNTHCQLNGPQSSVVTVSGANEQVTLNLQFNAAWAGKTLSIWMQGTNTSYQSGTWQKMGTFTVH